MLLYILSKVVGSMWGQYALSNSVQRSIVVAAEIVAAVSPFWLH